eukprot:scaffold81714_cov19-Tisochrysis_lutea.AAC.3
MVDEGVIDVNHFDLFQVESCSRRGGRGHFKRGGSRIACEERKYLEQRRQQHAADRCPTVESVELTLKQSSAAQAACQHAGREHRAHTQAIICCTGSASARWSRALSSHTSNHPLYRFFSGA